MLPAEVSASGTQQQQQQQQVVRTSVYDRQIARRCRRHNRCRLD